MHPSAWEHIGVEIRYITEVTEKKEMQNRITHQDSNFINQAIALKEDFPNSFVSHLAYQKLSTELLEFFGTEKVLFRLQKA